MLARAFASLAFHGETELKASGMDNFNHHGGGYVKIKGERSSMSSSSSSSSSSAAAASSVVSSVTATHHKPPRNHPNHPNHPNAPNSLKRKRGGGNVIQNHPNNPNSRDNPVDLASGGRIVRRRDRKVQEHKVNLERFWRENNLCGTIHINMFNYFFLFFFLLPSSLSLSLICIHLYMCIFIYVYVHRVCVSLSLSFFLCFTVGHVGKLNVLTVLLKDWRENKDKNNQNHKVLLFSDSTSNPNYITLNNPRVSPLSDDHEHCFTFHLL